MVRASRRLLLQGEAGVRRAAMAGLLAVVLAPAVVISPGSASAQSKYAYCAISRGVEGVYEDCSFATLEDCREELKGLGGFCQPNPRYVVPQQPREREREPIQAPGSRRR